QTTRGTPRPPAPTAGRVQPRRRRAHATSKSNRSTAFAGSPSSTVPETQELDRNNRHRASRKRVGGDFVAAAATGSGTAGPLCCCVGGVARGGDTAADARAHRGHSRGAAARLDIVRAEYLHGGDRDVAGAFDAGFAGIDDAARCDQVHAAETPARG